MAPGGEVGELRHNWAECIKHPREHGRCKAGVRPPGAPVHRSTASAWNRRDGGIVRPQAWAVVRLMTSVHGLGGSTDRLAALAPAASLVGAALRPVPLRSSPLSDGRAQSRSVLE